MVILESIEYCRVFGFTPEREQPLCKVELRHGSRSLVTVYRVFGYCGRFDVASLYPGLGLDRGIVPQREGFGKECALSVGFIAVDGIADYRVSA